MGGAPGALGASVAAGRARVAQLGGACSLPRARAGSPEVSAHPVGLGWAGWPQVCPGSGAGRQGEWAGPRGTGRRRPVPGPAGAAALATALAPEGGGWSGSTHALHKPPGTSGSVQSLCSLKYTAGAWFRTLI